MSWLTIIKTQQTRARLRRLSHQHEQKRMNLVNFEQAPSRSRTEQHMNTRISIVYYTSTERIDK